MDTRGSSQPMTGCRHLGEADNPFQHGEAPSEEHRCYLWMQRDRIDLDHQTGYCLSAKFRDCPWLQISLPCKSNVQEVWQGAIVCAMSDTGRWVWPRLLTVLRALALMAIAGARAFAVWAVANLPVAFAWLRRELPPRAGAAGSTLLHIVRRSGRRQSLPGAKPLKKRRDPAPALAAVAAPVATLVESFDVLMRLGQEASQAGHRKEAHLCFSRAAEDNPASADAWLWMAATADNPEESLSCLQKALAINPESGRARSQVTEVQAAPEPRTRKARGTARTLTSAARLIERGIASLDSEDEDEAYQLFVQATEADRASEMAWFWRAKTATDLDEVVRCLKKVLKLNPENEKARASLAWAVDRQKSQLQSSRPSPVREAQPVIPGLYSKPRPVGQPFLMQLASTAYMALGIIWVGPLILPALDGPLASLYRRIAILPVLQLPYLSSNTLVSDLSLPEFNVFYAVPLFLAVLSFVAMEVIWSENRAVSLFLIAAAAAGIVGVGVFGAGQAPTIPLSILSAAVGVIALGGRISYQRRARFRPAQASSY